MGGPGGRHRIRIRADMVGFGWEGGVAWNGGHEVYTIEDSSRLWLAGRVWNYFKDHIILVIVNFLHIQFSCNLNEIRLSAVLGAHANRS